MIDWFDNAIFKFWPTIHIFDEILFEVVSEFINSTNHSVYNFEYITHSVSIDFFQKYDIRKFECAFMISSNHKIKKIQFWFSRSVKE